MPNSVADHDSELMHYTTAAGLTGIVTSGCLWATHINFLNDSEEFSYFFKRRLPSLLATVIKEAGQRIKDMPMELAVSSDTWPQWLKERASQVFDTYIFSLCAASDDRIAADGLLSQWRGYGTDGGYAIGFARGRLEKMVAIEAQNSSFEGFPYFLHEVMYSDDSPAYCTLTSNLSSDLVENLLGKSAHEQPELFKAMLTLATCHKHGGFEEEREVRLVRICTNSELTAKEHPEISPRELPKTFIRGGVPVPYLELFSDRPDGSRHLPIKRVIVGPHRDQTRRIDAVQRLLAANGYAHVEVHGSAIPYLGR